MSFLEAVLRRTKRLERLLEEKYQAVGKGLHEKTTSVERQLSAPVVRQLRFIASVRNKLMHEDGYNYDRTAEGKFLAVCDEAVQYLLNHQPVIQTSYNTLPKPAILMSAAPRYAPATSGNTTVNRRQVNAAKPKVGRFKKLLMILGGLWLFSFIFVIALNIVLFFVSQSQTRNQPKSANKAQPVQVDSKILNSYAGQYDCKNYRLTVSLTTDSLRTSSPIATGVLTAASESEFAASGYSNNFSGKIKFTKNQKGRVTNLIIVNTNGSQEQCSKIK